MKVDSEGRVVKEEPAAARCVIHRGIWCVKQAHAAAGAGPGPMASPDAKETPGRKHR